MILKKFWPQPVQRTCKNPACRQPFTFNKTQASHEVKYCSPECRNTARTKNTQVSPAAELKNFDKTRTCIKKGEVCRHYTDCLEERLWNNRVSARYKTKGPNCFKKEEYLNSFKSKSTSTANY